MPVAAAAYDGEVAQLGEHCLRKAGVGSSSLLFSTTEFFKAANSRLFTMGFSLLSAQQAYT